MAVRIEEGTFSLWPSRERKRQLLPAKQATQLALDRRPNTGKPPGPTCAALCLHSALFPVRPAALNVAVAHGTAQSLRSFVRPQPGAQIRGTRLGGRAATVSWAVLAELCPVVGGGSAGPVMKGYNTVLPAVAKAACSRAELFCSPPVGGSPEPGTSGCSPARRTAALAASCSGRMDASASNVAEAPFLTPSGLPPSLNRHSRAGMPRASVMAALHSGLPSASTCRILATCYRANSSAVRLHSRRTSASMSLAVDTVALH